MKKRVIAVLLAGMMVMGNSMVTMAAETDAAEETTEATTEAEESTPVVFDEKTASFEGTWISFEAGFKLYLPSDWDLPEITDENAEAGLIFQAADSEKGWNVVVTETEVGAEYDNAKVVEELSTAYEDVSEQIFNDIAVVTYSSEKDDAAGVTVLSEDGYMYAINCTPVSDEDFAPMALDILTSISIDDTEETDAEADTAEETEEAAE